MAKTMLSLLAPAALALFAAGPALAAPNVVATIKPLHSLVAGVMQGIGTPDLLITGAGSPHTFSMRPSDAARLEGADLVFWIGPDLETFLTGPLDTLAADATKVGMMAVDGMSILPLREGGLFEAHAHGEDEDEHDHDHDHDHGHGDAHIWLDPQNARLMVAAIADALIAADPDNAATYNANGQALAADLEALQGEIGAEMAEIRDRPFFVFHDAYHGFEHRFGIAATGSFTVNPDIAPGAARLTEIRAVVAGADAVCIFAEPQFSPQVIETVAEGTGARIGTLDPLGAEIADGPELYFTLLRAMADSLSDCLADV
ncbi:zinc ABC transporter substrate-binding protein ZnuA [Pelagibacterium lacus]|uniref:High-affinity zinc uptake system protein ZnuA n=1 Tax=Pelagibacterium lacus TaxID=2282655 RepID=A0A369W5M8_9HYPH|nr:zinc ABC transporter substrate-binding protein ZnuA [Pelagibacterium lacus]RDE09966.1 zinc ABC transporter substrate-binding protein ZnuA [Pelagibacterium lacus]